MIGVLNATVAPTMDWKAAIKNGKKLYDTIKQMITGTWNTNNKMFEDIGKKVMRYQTVFDDLTKKFENSTRQDMLG
jgi:hypothetical protein